MHRPVEATATGEAAVAPAGAVTEIQLAPRRSRTSRLLKTARANPLATASAIILLVVGLAAAFAPIVATHDPLDQPLRDRLANPGMDHFLGADQFGRDVFSRILYGSRVSLFVGFAATFLGVGIGAIIGVFTGFAGGWIDLIFQRVIDAIMALPGLILLMSMAMVLGPTTPAIIVALTIFIIPPSVRVVRGHALTVSAEQYVDAARVTGASDFRILFRHILPNVFPTVIIAASVVIGAVILAEAALGFLGLGVKEPTPTLGNMLSTSGQQYMEEAPWLAISPGLVIMIVVGAFNLLGDGLRDILDPRLRGR